MAKVIVTVSAVKDIRVPASVVPGMFVVSILSTTGGTGHMVANTDGLLPEYVFDNVPADTYIAKAERQDVNGVPIGEAVVSDPFVVPADILVSVPATITVRLG